MARETERLPPVSVKKIKEPGYHADGGGLYLQVTKTGARTWVFRYTIGGRAREMGLGGLGAVSLAKARAKAAECRQLRADGLDPIEERDRARREAEEEAARAKTFKECAQAYIEAHKASWRNKKHADQWTSTLKAYAYPTLGETPVQRIGVAGITSVLEPIWTKKPETASRVRGRIEAVLDWATTRGYRQGDNPARWRGHLANILPSRAKVRRVEHHPALPYAEIGNFMAALRAEAGTVARALEFTILTAARTSEVIGARWEEIDLEAATWVIPAGRIKAGREHRVALSSAAIAVLKEMAGKDPVFVFPGARAKHSISNMAMLKLLARMKRSDLTVHGFRSSFRDWAAERTNFPREVAEMALAHAIGDKVEAAYRRGDLFKKRLLLMEAWAKHCGTPTKARGGLVEFRPTA